MAKKKVDPPIDPPVNEPEEGAEDKRSFSYMLDNPEEAPPPYTGEPVEESGETEEEKTAREAAEAEAAAAAAKPPEGEDEEFPKDLEEAKARVKAAQTKMHEATTTAAQEKEAREKAEKELADFKAEQERLAKEAAEAARPKALTEEEQDAIFANAMDEISQIPKPDQYDEEARREYHKATAKIWRKAVIATGESRNLPNVDEIAEAAANKAWEKIQAKETEAAAAREEQRKKDLEADQGRIEVNAREIGKKAGLKLDDPESADSILWDTIKRKIPQEVYDQNSLEAQAQWVTAEVQRRLGVAVQQTEEERQLALRNQNDNAVLGKGTPLPPKKPPERKSFNQMMEERTA